VETCDIPATSKVEVMAKLSTEDNDHTWVVEPTDSSVPVWVARAIVHPGGGLTPIQVINRNLIPVKVYKGSTVAYADTLDESIISALSENVIREPSRLASENLKDEEKEQLVALLELYSDVIEND